MLLPGWWNQDIRGGNRKTLLLSTWDIHHVLPLTEANLKTSEEFVFFFSCVNFCVLVRTHNKIPQSFTLFASRRLEGSVCMGCHKLLHPNLETRMKNICSQSLFVQLLHLSHWPLWACIQITVSFSPDLPPAWQPNKTHVGSSTIFENYINKLQGSWQNWLFVWVCLYVVVFCWFICLPFFSPKTWLSGNEINLGNVSCFNPSRGARIKMNLVFRCHWGRLSNLSSSVDTEWNAFLISLENLTKTNILRSCMVVSRHNISEVLMSKVEVRHM